MRLQCFKCSCRAQGALVVSGKERAGGEQAEFIVAPRGKCSIQLLRAPLELSRRIVLFRSMPGSGVRHCCNRCTWFAPVDVIASIVWRPHIAVESREQSVSEIRRKDGLRLREVGGKGGSAFVRKALHQDGGV